MTFKAQFLFLGHHLVFPKSSTKLHCGLCLGHPAGLVDSTCLQLKISSPWTPICLSVSLSVWNLGAKYIFFYSLPLFSSQSVVLPSSPHPADFTSLTSMQLINYYCRSIRYEETLGTHLSPGLLLQLPANTYSVFCLPSSSPFLQTSDRLIFNDIFYLLTYASFVQNPLMTIHFLLN